MLKPAYMRGIYFGMVLVSLTHTPFLFQIVITNKASLVCVDNLLETCILNVTHMLPILTRKHRFYIDNFILNGGILEQMLEKSRVPLPYLGKFKFVAYLTRKLNRLYGCIG